jgi:peptidyl-prolyl cis-trans isomerase A (cyclophilin A)
VRTKTEMAARAASTEMVRRRATGLRRAFFWKSAALVGSLSFSLFACEAEYPEPRFQRPKARAEETRRPREPRREPEQAELPQRPSRRGGPSAPDPVAGKFELKDALEGLPGKGKLHATIDTSLGAIECDLFDDKAPLTVANFVGLARGLRPFWDAKQSAWVKRPLYDGTTFHRVIPDFMIQGGDHMGNGTGDVGYNLVDELHPSLKHDRAGLLCMANKGPNTNGGQFFITDAATPHLTAMKTYTIFGDCKPTTLVHTIATVPKQHEGGERPAAPVEIKSVKITRR